MSILQNSIDAFIVGVEDFKFGTPARFKSSIRNVFAALLLLFKEKLRMLSPVDSNEILLKQRSVPKMVNGNLMFLGNGRKTVDLHEIQERLTQIGVDVAWKDVKSISEIRNDVEHYHTNANAGVIREAIAKAFVIFRSFMHNELNSDLKESISNETWEILLNVSELYDEERKSCFESQALVKSGSESRLQYQDLAMLGVFL